MDTNIIPNSNPEGVYSFYISKKVIDNSLLSVFKGRLYTDTFNNYKQIHILGPEIDSLMEESDKYKKINPLEFPVGDSTNTGVILVLPVNFLSNLDLTNVLNIDDTINETDTYEKINYIFDNILGYTYITFDIVRNILCLYDLFINREWTDKPIPINTTPYLDSVIDTNFANLQKDKILYGVKDVPNISTSTNYLSPDTSYSIAGSEDKYKLWGKIIMESIINALVIFPYDATIWTCIDVNNVKIENWFDIMCNILLYTGFSNPYFSTKNPLNNDYNYNFLGLIKKNDIKFVTTTDMTNEYNKILYLFNKNIINCTSLQKANKTCICSMNFFYNKETVLLLLRLPFNTQTININTDGNMNISQKEFSGAFKVKNISCGEEIKEMSNKLYKYTNNKGEIIPGYIAKIDLNTNKVKFLSVHKYNVGLTSPKDYIDIDIKSLKETCEYSVNNFICELEIDKTTISSEGKRNKTIDHLIDDVKNKYKTSNTTYINNIEQNLKIISSIYSTKKNDDYHEKLQKSTDSEIIKITKTQVQKDLEKKKLIKKKVDEVDLKIRQIINDTGNNITNLIEDLVQNNSSKLGYMLSGKESSVKSTEGLIQFHTHPYDEYIKNNWTICFPSGPDFSSFLFAFLFRNTIASAVVTVEGLYIISVNEYMCKEENVEKLEKAFNNTNLSARILMSFEFKKEKFETPSDFCDHINILKYDDVEFCNKINKYIDIYTTNDFYVGETVLWDNTKVEIVEKNTNGQYKLFHNPTTQTSNYIAEKFLSKDPENVKYLKTLEDYNLDKKQNEEIELKFLNLRFTQPLFKCEFKKWHELTKEIGNNFNITYPQKGKQCFIDFETIDIMNELYKYPGFGVFYNYDTSINPSRNLPKIFIPRTSLLNDTDDNIDNTLMDISTIELNTTLDDHFSTPIGSPKDNFNDSFSNT